MTKERRLGRGLAALLGAPIDDAGSPASEPGMLGAQGEAARGSAAVAGSGSGPGPADLLFLEVGEIAENPFQPRRDFSESEIASLAESLKEHDMLQPILVRQVGGRYQVISGERRLRAAIRAGWSKIPARVRQADDRLVAELAIVENLQRKDLNPIEKAMSFKRYLDQHGCTQDDLAQRLKIDRSTISNLMRLLELPTPVLDAIRCGTVSAGHARALLPLGDEREQIEFCERIQREGLSVRDVERMVQERLEAANEDVIAISAGARSRRRRGGDSHIASLEQELKLALGTRVEIRQASRGKGRIIVHFQSPEEFERLLGILAGPRRVGEQGMAG